MVQPTSAGALEHRAAAAPRLVSLWWVLVVQDVAARYRGTLLGRAWPVLMPLVMLAVYGFVFGAVFRARWPGLDDGDHLGFGLNLYAGLLVHAILAETVGQAPGLMLRHGNFVRKMVFPLPVLVAVPLGSALLHAGIGLLLIWLVAGFASSGWHASALAVPLVLLPYVAILYGFALMLSALGVYLRDLGQVVTVLVMVALFTGTVFFPQDMVPRALAGIVAWNPITFPVGAIRDALLHGHWPGTAALGAYMLAASAVLAAGLWMFAVLRRGFADLL